MVNTKQRYCLKVQQKSTNAITNNDAAGLVFELTDIRSSVLVVVEISADSLRSLNGNQPFNDFIAFYVVLLNQNFSLDPNQNTSQVTKLLLIKEDNVLFLST